MLARRDRPARLFEGLEHIQLTIVICEGRVSASLEQLNVTRCLKWSAVERDNLFATIRYAQLSRPKYLDCSTPKIGTDIELEILDKLWSQPRTLGSFTVVPGPHVIYYTRKIHAFLNVLDFVPEIRRGSGRRRDPSEQKTLEFPTVGEAQAALCMLNSSLFRWFITVFSDCRNLNRREVLNVPIDISRLVIEAGRPLSRLAERLSARLKKTSEIRSMKFGGDTLRVQCIIPRHAKDIIDQIDLSLGNFLGLSEAAVDFVTNYEIKYRLGVDKDDEE
jgi:hypothetical protein